MSEMQIAMAVEEVAKIISGAPFPSKSSLSKARRVVEHLESTRAPQWLPIESAPRDGMPYLASDGVNQRVENCPEGHAAGIWHHIDGDWRGVAFGDESKHWQPLPAPPEVKP